MEDQDKPRRDLKGLWLLPLLALGVGILLATRKPQPSERPNPIPPQMMQAEAYDHAKEQVMHRIMEGSLGGALRVNFAPYTNGMVTPLGQGRFRCSSSLEARFRTGRRVREHWQCLLSQSHGYWMCSDLQQTQWKQVSPMPVKRGLSSSKP